MACSKTVIALVEDGGCMWAVDLVQGGCVGCESGSTLCRRLEAEAERVVAKVLSDSDIS